VPSFITSFITEGVATKVNPVEHNGNEVMKRKGLASVWTIKTTAWRLLREPLSFSKPYILRIARVRASPRYTFRYTEGYTGNDD
jgi:hypothetical protein